MQDDCRLGLTCVASGVCTASSGTCDPSCGNYEICVANACMAIQPTVTVQIAAGALLSPQFPQVTVHVEATPRLTISGLTVNVVGGGSLIATGSIPNAAIGNNSVSLASFVPNAVGQMTVVATLSFTLDGLLQTAQSPAVTAFLDNQPPAVTVSVPDVPDTVNGWVPRTSANLEVRAQVDDGAGAGQDTATLTLDTCPAALPCSYDGNKQGSGSSKYFSFLVPRNVQTAGSEAAVPYTVHGKDLAGNVGVGRGGLPIDDSGPAIGAVTPLAAGVQGEDLQTWFAGGTGAPGVPVSVAINDQGGGINWQGGGINWAGTFKVSTNATDMASGISSDLAVAVPNPPDGTIRFTMPAASVLATKEGKMRVTITASDAFSHSTIVGPESEFILVDAVPPRITTLVPDLSISGAPPCGPADSATFKCGRTTSQLRRDDTAPVSFEVYDCGAGFLSTGVKVTSGGVVTTAAATEITALPSTAGPCPGSTNAKHGFKFQFDAGKHAANADPPDANNLFRASVVASAQDRTGLPNTSSAALIPIAMMRWKLQLPAAPTGAPALSVPVTANRNVVVGSDTGIASFGPSGSQLWSWDLRAINAGYHLRSDIAVGPTGRVFAAIDASSASACNNSYGCGILYGLSPSPTVIAQAACALEVGSTFGAPLALIPDTAPSPTTELAVVVATNHDPGGLLNLPPAQPNVFVYQNDSTTCSNPYSQLISGGEMTGVSGTSGMVFLTHGQGFTSSSVDTSRKLAGGANYAPTVATRRGPAVFDASPQNVIFSGTDNVLRAAQPSWSNATGFTRPAATTGNLNATPVFDSSTIYATDDQGRLYAWSRISGALVNSIAPAPPSGPQLVSPPVLLGGGTALVVQKDGAVRLLTPATSTAILVAQVNSGSGAPVAPVLEPRALGATAGSLAYVVDGAGWLWALHLNGAPLPASPTTWPRPGHDSCNSRYSGSTCN